MGHWSHRAVASESWAFLDEVNADLALLQEAAPVDDANDKCVWREIGGRRRWGSAIVSRRLPLEEITLRSNAHPGALTVARVELQRKLNVVLISMYGQLDEHGYSITTLHRMLSDLTHLLHATPHVILGGDLNASMQFDAKQGDESHGIFFQRLEDFGLRDCQGPFTEIRPRTLRHGRSDICWVNDYVFASDLLARAVSRAEVIETPAVNRLSDHNPVVVTFDVNASS